jgi:hypothetical protein
VSTAAITLCVASQSVFVVVYFVINSVLKLLDTPLYIMPLCTVTPASADLGLKQDIKS